MTQIKIEAQPVRQLEKFHIDCNFLGGGLRVHISNVLVVHVLFSLSWTHL